MTEEQLQQVRKFFEQKLLPQFGMAATQKFFSLGFDEHSSTTWYESYPQDTPELVRAGYEEQFKMLASMWSNESMQELTADLSGLAKNVKQPEDETREVAAYIYAMF